MLISESAAANARSACANAGSTTARTKAVPGNCGSVFSATVPAARKISSALIWRPSRPSS